MSEVEFKLPDVGEGLTEAEVVAWRVEPGAAVEVNQVVVEIETAKAVVELPSPHAGIVGALLVDEGQTVPVGTPLLSFRLADVAGRTTGTENGTETGTGPETDGEVPLLVGYGPRAGTRTEARAAPAVPAARSERTTPHRDARPAAKPPVRRLARELGVKLADIEPERPDGIISREEVLAAAGLTRAAAATAEAPQRAPAARAGGVAQPPGTGAGGERRVPIRGVRKHMAAAMVASAFTAPHVTEFLTVDVTASLELLERVRGRPEFEQTRVTALALVARALVLAVRRHPDINATWDERAQEIVVKDHVNLGIAAATARGLVVPNIRDAHLMSLRDLASGISELAATARDGRTQPEAMTGGTITITNVGVFGVDTGTPILNPGESAILAVGAIRRRPWVVGGGAAERLEIRSVLQLALSFDHRVVDGATGSRALADVAGVLEDPATAIL